MSDKLIIILLIFYAVILMFSIAEGHWARVEYWIGAILIVHATLRLR